MQYYSDKNNIISSFSPKTKLIINKNLPFKSGKMLSCFYGSSTYLISKDLSYEIYIGRNTPILNIENKFLHEFFHCVQYEEGYPALIQLSQNYKELATELTSFVLDLDVGDRLVKNEYDRNLEYNDAINKSIRLFEYIKSINDNKTVTSLVDTIGQGGITAHLKYFDVISNKDIKELIILTKTVRPHIYQSYKIMYKGIKMYSHNSPKDVCKIYKFLLRELNLQSYLSIR